MLKHKKQNGKKQDGQGMRALTYPALTFKSIGMRVSKKDKKQSYHLVPSTHGLFVTVGPTGAGKTLLAVTFLRQFYNRICHMCPPGDKTGCYERGGTKFTLLTNMRHPSILEWTEYLSDLDQLDDERGHFVVLVDEIHQFADSRRSQGEANINFARLISQSRKGTIRVYATSQTLRKLDVRLRSEAKTFFNVWNPDGNGEYIHAQVQNQADGTMPPYMRANPKQHHVVYKTAHMREHYDTSEVIDDESLVKRGANRSVKFIDANGKIATVSMPSMVATSIQQSLETFEAVTEGGRKGLRFTAKQIADAVNEAYSPNPPASEREVSGMIVAMDFAMDTSGQFFIPTATKALLKEMGQEQKPAKPEAVQMDGWSKM